MDLDVIWKTDRQNFKELIFQFNRLNRIYLSNMAIRDYESIALLE